MRAKHEPSSVANKAKAGECYQANSEQKRADERQRDLECIGSGKGHDTDPRHPIFNCIFPSINMYIFASYCSYDDDPCETLVKRGTKKILKRSEQRNRRDRLKKGARYRPSSSYFNLYLQTVCLMMTHARRWTGAVLKNPETKRARQDDADRSETQKEPGGTKKALNPSGLVNTNATLIMLKQEEQFKRLNSLGLN